MDDERREKLFQHATVLLEQQAEELPHVMTTPEGIQHSAEAFRRLIGLAIKRAGSYYLTYHKFASRKQLEACYPEFPQFLSQKRKHDPDDLFQSDWYRHYRSEMV